MNSCEHCVFRTNDGAGVQDGCRVGRLAAYQRLGLPERAPGGHYVIPGRLCGFNARKEAVEGQDPDELAARIRRDLRARARWLVAGGDRVTDPDRLLALAAAAAAHAPFVRDVRAVVRDRKTQREVSRRLADAGPGVPWAVRWLTDRGRVCDPLDCLLEDMQADKTDAQFALVLWGDAAPPDGFLAALDARVNDELEQVLYEDYGWGAVVSTHVFAALGHSADRPFPDRLEEALRPPGELLEEFVTPPEGGAE